MTGTDFIAVESVSKRFGVVQALDDVSLSFRPGEILALVGENGAGKSTLMRILEGVFPPDSGRLKAGATTLHFREPKEAHAAGIRVIHQEPEIVPGLTVAENIFLGALPNHAGVFLDRARLDSQTRAVLGTFGMEGDIEPRQICETLGPAQRQMIEIMRAVRAGGRLIAFDEPTSSLTDDEARRLFGVIRQLKSAGVGIIYISHRLNEIIELADRVAVLRDGRLVSDAPAAGASEASISRLMVGRDLKGLFQRHRRPVDQPLLEVRNLSTKHVFDITLTVHRGEVLGLGGLMGAGRSELAKAIVGYDRRVSGSITMAGRALAANDPGAAIAAGIGFAPEDRKHEALLLFRSVLDNAALCIPDETSRLGFFSRRLALAKVEPLARKIAIKAPTLDEPVARLSGGNQQKVVLARWLACQPMLLILDEPTRGIDIGAKAEIYRLVDELASAGIGILLISSEMPELIGLADRVLVMAGGRIRAELDGRDISEQEILKYAMPPSERPSEAA